jgi:hypothetical protein
MAFANTLAYYDMRKITAVERFIVKTSDKYFTTFFFLYLQVGKIS